MPSRSCPSLGARALRALPAGRREPRSTAFRAARLLETAALPARERYGALMEVFPAKLRAELYDAEPHRGDRCSATRFDSPRRAARAGIAGLQLLDARTYLPDDLLVKADRASMATSLELRSPLLDHEVLELGISLPDSLRLEGRRGKVALRRAFADLIPAELTARGKTGFGIPLGDWFRGPLRELAGDVLLGHGPGPESSCSPSVVKRLLAEHVSGERDHGHRLWCLLVLELWQRAWLDTAIVRAPDLAAADEMTRGRAIAIVLAAAVVPRIAVLALRARQDPRGAGREERPLRADAGREWDVRLPARPAFRLHAALVRVLPRGPLPGLRAALARRRASRTSWLRL